MDKWDKFKLTQAEWKEWHATKTKFKSGSSCAVCGATFSPFLTFCRSKGKFSCPCGR